MKLKTIQMMEMPFTIEHIIKVFQKIYKVQSKTIQNLLKLIRMILKHLKIEP